MVRYAVFGNGANLKKVGRKLIGLDNKIKVGDTVEVWGDGGKQPYRRRVVDAITGDAIQCVVCDRCMYDEDHYRKLPRPGDLIWVWRSDNPIHELHTFRRFANNRVIVGPAGDENVAEVDFDYWCACDEDISKPNNNWSKDNTMNVKIKSKSEIRAWQDATDSKYYWNPKINSMCGDEITVTTPCDSDGLYEGYHLYRHGDDPVVALHPDWVTVLEDEKKIRSQSDDYLLQDGEKIRVWSDLEPPTVQQYVSVLASGNVLCYNNKEYKWWDRNLYLPKVGKRMWVSDNGTSWTAGHFVSYTSTGRVRVILVSSSDKEVSIHKYYKKGIDSDIFLTNDAKYGKLEQGYMYCPCIPLYVTKIMKSRKRRIMRVVKSTCQMFMVGASIWAIGKLLVLLHPWIMKVAYSCGLFVENDGTPISVPIIYVRVVLCLMVAGLISWAGYMAYKVFAKWMFNK